MKQRYAAIFSECLKEGWRPACRQGRGVQSRHVRAGNALTYLARRLHRHLYRLRQARWRCANANAQGAVKRVAEPRLATVIALGQQLHAPARRANQFKRLRLDQRRGNRRCSRQGKPDQHKAGKKFGVAQAVHGADCRGLPLESAALGWPVVPANRCGPRLAGGGGLTAASTALVKKSIDRQRKSIPHVVDASWNKILARF